MVENNGGFRTCYSTQKDIPINSLYFTAIKCNQYFKGKRYPVQDYDCVKCPAQGTDAWDALTSAQQTQCTPVE